MSFTSMSFTSTSFTSTSFSGVAAASGVNAHTCQPCVTSSEIVATKSRARAYGRCNACPIDTRMERRASGSTLVASITSPSHPMPSALRTMLPMFSGLSTASASTNRRLVAARCATLARGGRSNSATTE